MHDIFNWERLMSFFSRIYYFLGINFLFIICNLPVLLFLLFVGISRAGTYLPLFFLCLLPAAPAFCAVLYAMERFVSGIETGAVRDYRNGYVKYFKRAVKSGALQLAVIFMIWTNLNFFTRIAPVFIMAVLFTLLFLSALLLTPNLYFFTVNTELSCLHVFKLALAYTLGKPLAAIGNLGAFGIILLAFELSPGTTVLFMGSIYGFLIAFMNRRIICEMKEKYSEVNRIK